MTPVPHSLTLARQVLTIEADALLALRDALDERFTLAVSLLLACKGRVVVSGMGKSGHIARKIAATMASTGTPAQFVHPAEAAHGDLGMITKDDVVIALSNSGESAEVLTLIPSLKRQGVTLLAITSNPESTLAKTADIHLHTPIAEEACPLNLAPTASTTAALALGDALAVALLDARGFSKDDFAFTHPGGSLGRRLLLKIQDIMHTGDALPIVAPQDLLKDALLEMTRKGLGMTAVQAENGQLLGIFTDGDLRRALDRDVDVRQATVAQVMHANPRTINAHKLAAEAVQVMQQAKINGLLVVDEQAHLVGMINMHDLLRAGVV